MIDWQDIETAPKDETWVLLYGDECDEPRVHAAFWSEEGRDWFDSEAASNSVTDFWQPTHWAALELPQ